MDYGGWSRLRVMTSTDVASMLKTVDNYAVTADATNVAGTSGSTETGEKVKVYGTPREAKGHPNTLWDAEDVKHYKQMLKENKEMQAQFEGLKKSLDAAAGEGPEDGRVGALERREAGSRHNDELRRGAQPAQPRHRESGGDVPTDGRSEVCRFREEDLLGLRRRGAELRHWSAAGFCAFPEPGV
jgi:hypothetical protein